VRSGCYAIHDDGLYRDTTPAATRSGPHFIAAAHVWARVLAVPEPGRAVLDAGKRDLAYDSALPQVIQIYRADATGHGSHLSPVAVGDATITALNDQHGYLSFGPVENNALRVGDTVKLGISHPCMVFDKWRSVLLLDPSSDPSAGGTVRGALSTFF
jgi:D-serine deaminase-like pyridoxal phosphate-dependent protein